MAQPEIIPDSPLSIIANMVAMLVNNTIDTLMAIINMFGDLLASLGFVSEVGGPLGFVVSIIIIAVVGYFVARIVIGSGKKLIIMLIIAIVLIYVLVLSALI